ncbi:hypothetical protein ACFWWT_49180 [Streptomyces sp. NPDC058676]|uniref:hypothetical protein n=1 Tax=unclassified Streptomyces TaxID=2593676 RepID=UPI00364DD16B
MGGLVGGAISPIIATSLLAKFHSWTPIAVYMAAAGVIALAACGFLREHSDRTGTQHAAELPPTAASPEITTARS